jgi:thymidine phosphorylase
VELTIDLCATLLLTCGAETDEATARRKLRDTLTSGAAAERFGRMVAALGGPADFVPTAGATTSRKPLSSLTSPRGHPATSPPSTAARWAWRSSAWAAAGSRAATPSTPPWASRTSPASGRRSRKGDPLFRLHARDDASAEAARAAILAAITIGDAPAPRPLVHERIG